MTTTEATEIMDALTDMRKVISNTVAANKEKEFITHGKCDEYREGLEKSLNEIGTRLERNCF